jgi:DNA-binding response OmpR family regulator
MEPMTTELLIGAGIGNAGATYAAPNGRPRRVLIADDDGPTRTLVRLLLEGEEFEVLEAGNGRQAIDIVCREHPDLLVLDLMMPGVNGYDTLSRLRSDRSSAGTSILVLTSQSGPDVYQRVLEMGADGYLTKPFDAAVLLSRVEAILRRRQPAAATRRAGA